MDFGANKALTGGLTLQTLETYTECIGTEKISFGGHDFGEDDFDSFVSRLKEYSVKCVDSERNIRGDSVRFIFTIRKSYY